MGDDIRDGDIRIPLILCVFCLLVTAGGALLVIYVFVPSTSRPWYPIAAIVLVGSPWAFWFLMYLYTCAKSCCLRSSAEDGGFRGRQISRRPTSSAKEPETPLAYVV